MSDEAKPIPSERAVARAEAAIVEATDNYENSREGMDDKIDQELYGECEE